MEELKLILKSVENLGGNAQWLFIAYLVKEAIIYILGFSCLAGGLAGAYKVSQRLIPAIAFENQIKEIMGCGSWFSPTERSRILNILRESRR